jgi:NAD(P)-dependent dehydrogenase (short-subunit alcohol dehydrogenase family)/acyl carrier protein
LVFVDESGVAEQLVQRLEERGERVVTVIKGQHFAKLSESSYSINPIEGSDYLKLLASTSGSRANKILHTWSLETSRDLSEAEGFERAQGRGLYSLLHLTRALAQQRSADELDIVVITASAFEVNGSEEVRPEAATISGACRVIPQEYNNFRCRHIDVELSELNSNVLTKQILSSAVEPTVAIRGAYPWIPTYEQVRLDHQSEAPIWLQPGGVYLITGGLGRIGLTLARYLAQTVKANLVLLNREGLPPRSDWKEVLQTNDNGSEKLQERIQQVLSLQEIATDVLVIEADVADERRMREAIAETLNRFERIDGVIHAAGVVGEKAHRAVSETGQQECSWHFRPKVFGSYVLEKVLDGVEYGFCIFVSSLSPILGGLGFSAYASAHAFMDAFVQKHNRCGGPPWMTINWEGWQRGERTDSQLRSNAIRFTTTPAEALDSFERIVKSESMPQVVISTGNFQLRIDQWTRFLDHAAEVQTQLHVRPSLRTPYIAPENDTQRTIAEIWQRLLGIERVGLNDSFFDLGGHSLLAIQLVSRLRESFRMDLPLRTIFESLTVAGLAAAVTQRQVEEVGQERLSDMVAAIKQLSKAELESAVMAARQGRSKVK